VVDKSPGGAFLDVRELMEAARNVFAERHLLGRFNPRLWWFWLHYPPFIQEMESYVQEIRLRVDAATPVPHDQRRVFEDFTVPLEHGQQTAIGGGCFFVLEKAEPSGAVPYWRYCLTRDDQIIVGPLVLRAMPIYYQDELLGTIRKVGETTVILSVLTSEGAGG